MKPKLIDIEVGVNDTGSLFKLTFLFDNSTQYSMLLPKETRVPQLCLEIQSMSTTLRNLYGK